MNFLLPVSQATQTLTRWAHWCTSVDLQSFMNQHFSEIFPFTVLSHKKSRCKYLYFTPHVRQFTYRTQRKWGQFLRINENETFHSNLSINYFWVVPGKRTFCSFLFTWVTSIIPPQFCDKDEKMIEIDKTRSQ